MMEGMKEKGMPMMMEKMMGRMMEKMNSERNTKVEKNPEGMQGMMNQMFSSMSVDHRIQMISSMMPRFIKTLYSGLNDTDKEKLTDEIFMRVLPVIEEQLTTENQIH